MIEPSGAAARRFLAAFAVPLAAPLLGAKLAAATPPAPTPSTTLQVPAAHAQAPTPLALSCTGCHQSHINSPSMPALDTLEPAKIAAVLRLARDSPQSGSIMARFAAKLSDADIDQLARELGRARTP